MKKLIFTLAAVLMAATSFAQQQGDITLAGTLEFYHTRYTDDLVYTNYMAGVEAGYFIADNIAIVAGLDYDRRKERAADGTKEFTTIPSITVGARYYYPISGKFFWTPAVLLCDNFEFSKTVFDKSPVRDHDFNMSYSVDFASFEYMVNNRFSITTSIGGLSFGAHRASFNLSTEYTSFGFRFWL